MLDVVSAAAQGGDILIAMDGDTAGSAVNKKKKGFDTVGGRQRF